MPTIEPNNLLRQYTYDTNLQLIYKRPIDTR